MAVGRGSDAGDGGGSAGRGGGDVQDAVVAVATFILILSN